MGKYRTEWHPRVRVLGEVPGYLGKYRTEWFCTSLSTQIHRDPYSQGGDTAPDLYRRMAITRPYRRAVLFFYYEKNEITYASAFSCTGRWP